MKYKITFYIDGRFKIYFKGDCVAFGDIGFLKETVEKLLIKNKRDNVEFDVKYHKKANNSISLRWHDSYYFNYHLNFARYRPGTTATRIVSNHDDYIYRLLLRMYGNND